jgi:prolyl oligopeptidase
MTMRTATVILTHLFLVLPVLGMPPETPRRPVTDEYHDVPVIDDYRWLEDANDDAVRKWSDAQNALARQHLDRLPHVDAIRRRVTEIMSEKTVSYFELAYRHGTVFAMKREPPKQQPFLIVIPSLSLLDQARVLLDPNELDAAGTTAIDWYVPSPDGKLVAVSLSKGGSESGDVSIFETATGKQVFETVPRVNSGTAGGDLAWLPEGTGFFYTRHPHPGEREEADLNFFQQAYFHALGTPTDSDRYEIGKNFPRVAEIEFEMHPANGTLLLTVQNGDGGHFAHYVRSSRGEWKQVSTFEDDVVQMTFGPNEDLYLISREGAPRGKIQRVPLGNPDVTKAETIVPEGPDTIVTSFYHSPPSLLPTATRLYVLYQLGGPSELRVFDLSGKPQAAPRQLPLATAGGLTKLEGDSVLFSNTSFLEPPAWYRFDAGTGETTKTALATDSPVDFRDIDVAREFATSKDGTKVPVNLLFPKGMKRDGKNPCLVTGYGGYGTNISPGFSAVRRVLLDQGFVIAVANLRGGGEYGDPWHRQGSLTKKQNVFDDFAAVLQHMIDRGYTSPRNMAIEGGSNGGLLMGATFTQHPELMRAVVSHVGIYDMLRVELSPNGVFNIVEFGTVTDPEQFKALYAYSPYHHVHDGTQYPAVLFLTGANDPRVDPMQSRKMTARLQAAASKLPILLRTTANAGHGGDTSLSERIEQYVDVFAFLFDQLGVEFQTKDSTGK